MFWLTTTTIRLSAVEKPGDNTGLKNLHLNVLLPGHNPPVYNKFMANTNPASFGQVCSFLVTAIDLLGGEYVTCK